MERPSFYILDENHQPIPLYYHKDFESNYTYMKWMEDGDNRRVALDVINEVIRVSTVFLGIDHGIDSSNPVLFETMVFDDRNENTGSDLYMRRYTSWDEAKQGHEVIVKTIKERLEKSIEAVADNVLELPSQPLEA